MSDRYLACYREWYQRQALDLDELVDALSAHKGGARTDAELRDLVNKSMRHYEEYYQRRRLLLHEDGPLFYCPPWCNSFESAFLWLGGCRPSLYVRLLYSLSSVDLEAHIQGNRLMADEAAAVAEAAISAAAGGGMMALSATQLDAVNRLHRRALQEEDKLLSEMATLQEGVAGRPLLRVVKERHQEIRRLMLRRQIRLRGSVEGTSCDVGAGETEGSGNEADGEVEEAMEEYARELSRLLEAADELRIATAREMLMGILTTEQAVELLVAGKRLHVSVHEWGRRRDIHHGRACQVEVDDDSK